MGSQLTEMGVLMCFVFMRLIESRSLTILCGGKDKRYRFAKKALKAGWIKEIKIRVRERTTHQTTLYALTKKGLTYLCANTAGTFLDHLTAADLRSMAIFEKDEYSDEARKRIANTATAMIMAMAMDGTIPVEVFNRRYKFGCADTGNVLELKRSEGAFRTLNGFLNEYFSDEDYCYIGIFGGGESEGEKICYYDGAYVKQAVSGTRDRKAARDYYKGREIGIFQSSKHSLLVYYAPFFGQSWSQWQTKPEINAIISWNRRYASKQVLTSLQYSALLIVKDSKQFANLYHDIDHVRKEHEVFGGRFDHLYLAEHSAYGVELLHWLLSNSDEEIDKTCTSIVEERQLATLNGNPSRKLFRYRDKEGNEGMCGFHLDVKRMRELDRWARKHPEQKFVVFCVEPQVPYYRGIMPENVSYVLL